MDDNYCTQCKKEGKTCGAPYQPGEPKNDQCFSCTHKLGFHSQQSITAPPSESKGALSKVTSLLETLDIGQKKLFAQQEQLDEKVAKLDRLDDSITNMRTYGKKMMTMARKAKVVDIAQLQGGEAVIAKNDAVLKEIQDTCSNAPPTLKEKIMNCLLTPYFNKLSSNDLVLVNGEDYGSIPAHGKHVLGGNDDLKPDFLSVREAFLRVVTTKPKSSNAILASVRSEHKANLLFGNLADWKLRDSISAVWAGKYKEEIDDSCRGELINYLIRIAQNRGSGILSYGIMYNQTNVELFTCDAHSVRKVEMLKWTDAGSFDYMRDFLQRYQDPWGQAISTLCQALGIQICMDQKSEKSFLGSGANGRVFLVQKPESEDKYALKVLIDTKRYLAELETHKLNEINETCAKENDTSICVTVQKHLDYAQFSGYLMTPVGTSVYDLVTSGATSNNENRTALITASRELLDRLHGYGYIHGDPRIKNIIMCDGELLFIDVVDSCRAEDFDTAKQRDVEMFDASVARAVAQ